MPLLSHSLNLPCCSRRHLLQLGTAALTASMLPEGFAAPGLPSTTTQRGARQVIIIFLQGGLSHLDSWDLKPSAPAEYRGEFRPIATSVPGFMISEHMPLLSQMAHKYNVIRSTYHGTPSHEAAIHWTLTGYDFPGANTTTKNRNTHPAMGSIVSRTLGPNQPGLPPYVCIPDKGQLGDRVRYGAASYLGVAHDPFEAGMPPSSAQAPFPIPPNLSLAKDVDLSRLECRMELLHEFDQLPRRLESNAAMSGLDEFNRQAMNMLAHDVTRKAFDLSSEPLANRLRYGNTNFAQRLVLARRLAEAGVNLTLVNFANNQDWDTHTSNFQSLKKTRLPELDMAVATLLEDLQERGLFDSTLVALFGEFGRTPRINATAGRDHWSNVFSVMLAGGGLKQGQVIGTSTSNGEDPQNRPVHFNEIMATIYRQMGIPCDRTYPDSAGRPIPILSSGQPLPELI